jgi:hypothetical protein
MPLFVVPASSQRTQHHSNYGYQRGVFQAIGANSEQRVEGCGLGDDDDAGQRAQQP